MVKLWTYPTNIPNASRDSAWRHPADPPRHSSIKLTPHSLFSSAKWNDHQLKEKSVKKRKSPVLTRSFTLHESTGLIKPSICSKCRFCVKANAVRQSDESVWPSKHSNAMRFCMADSEADKKSPWCGAWPEKTRACEGCGKIGSDAWWFNLLFICKYQEKYLKKSVQE